MLQQVAYSSDGCHAWAHHFVSTATVGYGFAFDSVFCVVTHNEIAFTGISWCGLVGAELTLSYVELEVLKLEGGVVCCPVNLSSRKSRVPTCLYVCPTNRSTSATVLVRKGWLSGEKRPSRYCCPKIWM
jgi:hypothetical protein